MSTDVQVFDKRQIEIMRRTIAKDVPPEDFLFFLEVAKYRGLNPFNREIYAIMRGKNMTIQAGIDGLRKLAEKSGKYKGQLGPMFCGQDGVWKDEWLLSTPPVAAKVGILRSDFEKPMWAVARYEAYVQLKDGHPNEMWKKFFDVLLAKCAEALAIRKAFPAECGGLYASEEMQQADTSGSVVVESVAPTSHMINFVYESGKGKGLWSDKVGFLDFATVELGVNVTRETVYELSEEQLKQIEAAIEEEKAVSESHIIVDSPVVQSHQNTPQSQHNEAQQSSQDKTVSILLGKAKARVANLGMIWDDVMRDALKAKIADSELTVQQIASINGVITQYEKSVAQRGVLAASN